MFPNGRDGHDGEEAGRGELVFRARRLTERLELLKRKLAMCFQYGDDMARARQSEALRRQQALLEEVRESRQQREAFLSRVGISAAMAPRAALGEFPPYDPADFGPVEEEGNVGGGADGAGGRASGPYGDESASLVLTPQIVLEQMAAVEADDAPEDFVCPITQCLMVDPVFTADGSIYERAAITEWFRSFQMRGKAPTSPLTNLVLEDLSLTPSPELRVEIQKFLDASVAAQKTALAAARTANVSSGRALPSSPPGPSASTQRAEVSRVESGGGNVPTDGTTADERGASCEDPFARHCTFEDPSLRQLSPHSAAEAPTGASSVNASASAAASSAPGVPVIAGGGETARGGATASAVASPPHYDSSTIDVGALRRAFQAQQSQREREREKELASSLGGPQKSILPRTASLSDLLARHRRNNASTQQGQGVEGGDGPPSSHAYEGGGAAEEAFAQMLRHRSDGAARTLDPSLIALLTNARGGGARGESNTTAASAAAPIWSSAVVPLHEQNSRVLNLLRVRDDVAIGDDGAEMGAGVGAMFSSRPLGLGSGGGSPIGGVGLLGGRTFVSPTVNHSRTAARLADARRAAAAAASPSSPSAASVTPPPSAAARPTRVAAARGGGFPNDLYSLRGPSTSGGLHTSLSVTASAVGPSQPRPPAVLGTAALSGAAPPPRSRSLNSRQGSRGRGAGGR